MSKGTEQVIAAVIQVRHEGRPSKVHITLARNGGDLKTGRLHLLHLWPRLQTYSTLCEVVRQTDDPPTNWEEHKGETPPKKPKAQSNHRPTYHTVQIASSHTKAPFLKRNLRVASPPAKIYDVSITFSLP